MSSLTHYPNPDYGDLRRAIATFHQIDPDWVLPGNGAAELLTWAGRELAEQSVTYLPTPAFADYWRGLRAFNARVQPCPLSLESPQGISQNFFATLAPALGLPGAPAQDLPPAKGTAAGREVRAGFLMNTPHNPSGRLWSRQDVLPWLDWFGLVVVDEAFMDFLPEAQQDSLIPDIEHHPQLVVLRSLTKFYSLPGLRLGYALGHPDRWRRWHHWRDPWPVNGLAVEAGKAALVDRAFQEQTWAWLAIARPQLFQGLAAIPGLHPLPGVANYVLVRSDDAVPPLQEALLQRHRLLIRDCLSFPELGDRYFRVAVRTVEENQRLLAGLAEVIAQVPSPNP